MRPRGQFSRGGSGAEVAKRSRYPFFMLLLVLYPIMPINHYVGSLSYANLCGVLMVLSFFLFRSASFNPRIIAKTWWYWQYLVVYAVFMFTTGSTLNGFSWVVVYLLVSVSIVFSIETPGDFHRAIDGIICGGVLIGVVGILESATGSYLIQPTLMSDASGYADLRYGLLRSTGPYGSPINFGLYEAIAGTLVTYRLSTSVRSPVRRLLWIAYIPIVLSMFLSVSRLAICVFVLAHIVLMFRIDVRKGAARTAVVGTIGVFSVAVAWALSLDLRFLGNALRDFGASVVAAIQGSDQPSATGEIGFGNRFDLYAWVIEDVGKHWLTGLGVNAEFAFPLDAWTTKTSIEVNYLYVFFHCGIVGLSSLVLLAIGNLLYAWMGRAGRIQGERSFGFSDMAFLILLLYYMAQFGVQETDLARLHFTLVSLLIAYRRLSCKEQGFSVLERKRVQDA